MKKILSIAMCIIMLMTSTVTVLAAGRNTAAEEAVASQLKSLGLFKGVSDTDFDLDRAPTRVEALIMLIRVLGKEQEAQSGNWTHPFTDVPAWADKYIGYAYSNKLTNGQSATEFGTGTASDTMYITFVLRALGYSDTNGQDFVWDNPFALARKTGILSDNVRLGAEFLRADVVTVSANALRATLKNSNTTLSRKLINSGVFTEAQYNRAFASAGGSTATVTGAGAFEVLKSFIRDNAQGTNDLGYAQYSSTVPDGTKSKHDYHMYFDASANKIVVEHIQTIISLNVTAKATAHFASDGSNTYIEYSYSDPDYNMSAYGNGTIINANFISDDYKFTFTNFSYAGAMNDQEIMAMTAMMIHGETIQFINSIFASGAAKYGSSSVKGLGYINYAGN